MHTIHTYTIGGGAPPQQQQQGGGGDEYHVRALYEFAAESGNELSFRAGDVITWTQDIDNDWMEGMLNGRVGIFPRNYVEFM